jgi:hypothetical protein
LSLLNNNSKRRGYELAENIERPIPPEGTGQLVLYHTEDGRTRISVRPIQESVWLTLNQISDPFQRDKSVISKHIKDNPETGELHPERTVAKFATVQNEGGRSVTREIEFYRPGAGHPQRARPLTERRSGQDVVFTRRAAAGS